MAKFITAGEFAKKKGISLKAVHGHIERGNIPAEKIKGRWQLDEKKAEEAFSHIDPNQSLNGRKNQDRDFSTNEPGKKKSAGQTFSEARAMREAYNAQIAKLTFDEKAGKLIDKNEAKAMVFRIGREIRDALLMIPEKLSDELASVEDPVEISSLLEEEIRETLDNLKNIRI